MAEFTTALRDALLRPNARESAEAVHTTVIKQLRTLDPQIHPRTTGYYNHTIAPDIVLTWRDGTHRNVFLRFALDPSDFDQELRYARDDSSPVFLDIAQPELALDGRREPIELDEAEREQLAALGDRDAMLTQHEALDTLGSGLGTNPSARSATQQVVRGGRGLIDAPVAERVLESYGEVAELLGDDAIAGVDPDRLREALDSLETPLSRIARLDLETELRARWIRGGREAELFPSLEGWNLRDRSAQEITTIVMALLASEEEIPPARWTEIAEVISVDALGSAARGRHRVTGGKLNQLVRAAQGYWTARWAWVPAYGDARPTEGTLDWSLGGTSLELNLDTHRAIFVDNGARLNMLTKPDELPFLEPRLPTLEDSAVRGVTLVTTEETIGVHLRATSSETLGQRLRRLMETQTEIRTNGRVARLQLQLPGTEIAAEIDFESGKMRADQAAPLATLARAVARFFVALPEEQLLRLSQRLTTSEAQDE